MIFKLSSNKGISNEAQLLLFFQNKLFCIFHCYFEQVNTSWVATKSTFTCSNSGIETPEQCEKSVQI